MYACMWYIIVWYGSTSAVLSHECEKCDTFWTGRITVSITSQLQWINGHHFLFFWSLGNKTMTTVLRVQWGSIESSVWGDNTDPWYFSLTYFLKREISNIVIYRNLFKFDLEWCSCSFFESLLAPHSSRNPLSQGCEITDQCSDCSVRNKGDYWGYLCMSVDDRKGIESMAFHT